MQIIKLKLGGSNGEEHQVFYVILKHHSGYVEGIFLPNNGKINDVVWNLVLDDEKPT